jgi:hypothetical protein
VVTVANRQETDEGDLHALIQLVAFAEFIRGYLPGKQFQKLLTSMVLLTFGLIRMRQRDGSESKGLTKCRHVVTVANRQETDEGDLHAS